MQIEGASPSPNSHTLKARRAGKARGIQCPVNRRAGGFVNNPFANLQT